VNDRVILPAQVWDILHIDVQVILPAHFWVNKFVNPPWVDDGVMSPVQVQTMVSAHFWVNLYTTLQWVNDNVDDHAVQRFCSHYCLTMHSMNDHDLLPILKKSDVSVWRNPTAQYDVTNYPYFVFHLNHSESSSFSETLKCHVYYLIIFCSIV
jgi:hypothetical protein